MDPLDPRNHRLATASEIIENQRMENELLAQRARMSRIRNMTPRVAIDETLAAAGWLFSDFRARRRVDVAGSWKREGAKHLRGLGLLLVFVAVVLMAVDAFVGDAVVL